MKICGVVAEYNPFHNGHAWHIEQTRRRLGPETAIVCCMSGNWVQRGEAALLPKHIRARMALTGGADLVFELPAAHALRSAEGFAQSAVGLLAGLGVVTDLSFGAEHDNLDDLRALADALSAYQTVRDTLAALKTGISYASARERALHAAISDKAALIQSPNNILAVEYLRAIAALGGGIEPMAVPRAGAGHDSPKASGRFASASMLRAALREGQSADALAHLMPAPCAALLAEATGQGRALGDLSRLEAIVLGQLYRQTPESLAALGDVSEGLEHRLHAAIARGPDLAAIQNAAKTRRYPEARIRRLLVRAFLGLPAQPPGSSPAYARVLGMNERGRRVLRLAARKSTLPLITKPAHAKRLSSQAGRDFALEALAADLYHLALPAWRTLPPGEDWRTGPVFVPLE